MGGFSGWGGLSKIIAEAKAKEEEERKKAELQRALELYREQERASQQPVQGPPPAPKPLPNPWQKPVFTPPKISTPPPSPLQQLGKPTINTGTPSIGIDSGQNVPPTVPSEVPSPVTSKEIYVAPRPLSQSVSLSDRLRENYNAPDRPLVPTAPQGPAAQWKPPGFAPPPQSRYTLQPDELPQGPGMTQQQVLDTQGQWGDWLNQQVQQVGQGAQDFISQWMPQVQVPQLPGQPAVGNTTELMQGLGLQPNANTHNAIVPSDAANPVDWWQWFSNSPEYMYAQERSKDRREWETPSFGELLQKRMTNPLTGEPLPMPPEPADYAMAGLTKVLNEFGPSRQGIIRLGDVVDRTFGTQWGLQPVLTEPIPGLNVSTAEYLTATGQGLYEGYKAMQSGDVNMFDFITNYVQEQTGKTKAAREQVQKAVEETGDGRLSLALRNISGGSGDKRTTDTLYLLQNRDQIVQQLYQQANELVAHDPNKAGELFLQANELQNMSYADMVDANMDIRTELLYGLIDPSDALIAPIAASLRILPEVRSLLKAKKAVNIPDAAVATNLAGVAARAGKLRGAVAEGPKAAQQVYREIIAPFQGAGEKFINSEYLSWALTGRATEASKIALDTKILDQAVTGIMSGITSKADAAMILGHLIDNPGQLVKGVVGLTQETLSKFGAGAAGLRWDKSLLGTNAVTRRLPFLASVREQILGMESLKGSGNLNPIEFQAELHEILSGEARRLYDVKQPKTLPFGASDVKIERLNGNDARVVYVDSKGKVIMAAPETTIVDAQHQLAAIKDAQAGRIKLKDVPYFTLKTLADVQRSVMNDVWLFARTANWAGNALSASIMLYAHDAYTPLPLKQIQENLAKVMGGYQPTPRMFNTLPGVTKQTRTWQDEVGGSAIGAVAAGVSKVVTGKTDNIVTRGMNKLQQIPYGTTEFKFGDAAIPIGEEAFSARAFYVPFTRVRTGEMADNISKNLVPKWQAIEGISPQMVDAATKKLLALAEDNDKAGVLEGMRTWIGKPKVAQVLAEIGVPRELLLPQEARAIEQLLMDAAPSDAPAVAQELTNIFSQARNRAAGSLHIDPGQPNVHWTDADLAQEAGWIADVLREDAIKAGVDEATAGKQATELATTLLQEQQSAFEHVMRDFGTVATKPGALESIMDFFLDFKFKKGRARDAVDEAGRIARSTNTNEAWTNKWRATNNIYNGLRDELGKMVEETRITLQNIYNGEAYGARYNWSDVTNDYLNWDEEAFHVLRATPLGGIEEDATLWQQVIDANRTLLDNAQYELLGAFQVYPTVEAFDIVKAGLRRTEAMGAEAAFRMAQLRKQRAAGELSAEQYNKARNDIWNKYFDDAAILNQTLGKVIVRRGLEKQAVSELRWTDSDGQTWSLMQPSQTQGKWVARNEQTGKVEEFTVAQSEDEIGPFVVPKNVVEDFRRLGGDDAELDKAAAQIMQEISDSAPPVIREYDNAYNAERFQRDPSYQQWWEEQQAIPAEERLSYQEWWQQAGLTNEGITPQRVVPPDTPMTAEEIEEALSGLTASEARRLERELGLPSRFTRGGPARGTMPERVPPADAPQVEVWREPDTEPNVPGYNNASLRRAETLPEEIPTTPQRAMPVDVEPVTPEVAPIPAPTNNAIRAAASDAGIATATKAGRPTDKHLVASLNKRMGTKITRLDDLSDTERSRAIGALQARKEEQVSRMSPAEAQKSTPSTVGTGNAPTFGEGTRSARPQTESMFAESGEDLPLVSGAAPRVEDRGPFAPSVEGRTESMFEMRPELGSKTPSYKPRTPKQSKVTTPGDMAKGEITGLQETRTAMRKEWEKQVQSSFTQTGKDRSIPNLDTLVMRYGREGRVNLNLDKGELKIFEDIYGTNVAGFQIDNLSDLERFLQQYVDLKKQIDRGQATVAKSKEFAKMSGPEILKATRDEWIADGWTDADLAELAKTVDRRTILDNLEKIRGDDVPLGMVGYDSTVPSISHVLSTAPGEDGYNVWRRLTGIGRRAGNSGPVTQADVAQVTIENLNDAERVLKSRLSEILTGTPNTLTGAQKLAMLDATAEWLPNMDQVNLVARMVGDDMASWIMLNVDSRRDFDTLLSLMVPYHYFWTRMPSRLLTAALQKPGLVNKLYEIKRAIQLENKREGVPERLEGTVWLPGGSNARVNISTPIFHYAAGGGMNYVTPNSFVEDDPTDNTVERWMKAWERNGGPGFNLWLRVAADLADGKLDKDYTSILTNLVPIPFVGVPGSSAYQALTGDMPEGGNPWNLGFGPDKFDPYRARRAVTWIAEKEGIDPTLAGFASQVIVNQYEGNEIGFAIPEEYLAEAQALADRAVRQAAQDRIAARSSAYLTTMSVNPWTQEEQDIQRAQERYYVSGYNPLTGQGSKALQQAQLEQDPSAEIGWTKSGETPGIDAQIDLLYKEAYATGDWDKVIPQIEALQAQKEEITGEPAKSPPMLQPTPGSTSDILRGSYGNAIRGMNPQEQVEEQRKQAANVHWDAYHALEDNAEKAQYLRNNPDFQEIYKQNIIDKGETPEDWWSDYPAPGKESKGATKSRIAEVGAKGGRAPAEEGGGLAPGSVTRDDFTEEQLDQYYGEYFAFNETQDWDGQKAWLLDHPEFARLEADRKLEKDGEYPWWYDDILGGSAAPGAVGLQRPPSQPTSVADVLRRPYDAPGTGDNQGPLDAEHWKKIDKQYSEYERGGGKSRGKGGYGGGGNEWGAVWEEYRNLPDSDAKRQFLLDNPDFAAEYLRYIREQDPNAEAWWLKPYNPRTGFGYSYGGWGGGGGGGSPYLGGGTGFQFHNARVDPRFMNQQLWQGPGQQRQWIPYSDPTPQWLEAGRQLQPDPIRRWEQPRW